MRTRTDKAPDNQSEAASVRDARKDASRSSACHFVDNRPESAALSNLQAMAKDSAQAAQLRAFQKMADASPQVHKTAQLNQVAQRQGAEDEDLLQGKFDSSSAKANNTGLPDNLKSGMENTSGFSMDNVKVHYNSSKPAQLQALTYNQGNDIHVAPGQERHLAHEAWHVAPRTQGSVQATTQIGGTADNDSQSLAKEAGVMGARASHKSAGSSKSIHARSGTSATRGVVSRKGVAQLATLQLGAPAFLSAPAAPRKGNNIGLGEQVALNSAATGPVKKKEGAGGPVYNVDSGSGSISGTTLTAEGAGAIIVSVKRSDEPDTLKHKMNFKVVVPKSATFQNTPPNNGGFGGDAGAGFYGNNTIYEPRHVSFNGVGFREGSTSMVASGAFKKLNGLKHDIGTEVSPGQNNVENTSDDICSGGVSKSTFEREGSGMHMWKIPWQYRLAGRGGWTDFMVALHRADIDKDGTVRMRKLNGDTSRAAPGGPWKQKPKG